MNSSYGTPHAIACRSVNMMSNTTWLAGVKSQPESRAERTVNVFEGCAVYKKGVHDPFSKLPTSHQKISDIYHGSE